MPDATWTTKSGRMAVFRVRPDSSDWNNVNAVIEADEYGLAGRSFAGLALDVGAHIGEVAVALALDNPDLRVIGVEALPENVGLARFNIEANGLTERVSVIEGAASSGTEPVRIAHGFAGSETARVHRYIGGLAVYADISAETLEAAPVSLSALVAEHGPIRLLVIDCEGGEWSFLADPAVAQVEEILGEWHTRGADGAERLHALLEPTHTVWHEGEHFGPFRAVRLAA